MSDWHVHVDQHLPPDGAAVDVCSYCRRAARRAVFQHVQRELEALHEQPEADTVPDASAALPLAQLMGGDVDELDLPELPPLVARVLP